MHANEEILINNSPIYFQDTDDLSRRRSVSMTSFDLSCTNSQEKIKSITFDIRRFLSQQDISSAYNYLEEKVPKFLEQFKEFYLCLLKFYFFDLIMKKQQSDAEELFKTITANLRSNSLVSNSQKVKRTQFYQQFLQNPNLVYEVKFSAELSRSYEKFMQKLENYLYKYFDDFVECENFPPGYAPYSNASTAVWSDIEETFENSKENPHREKSSGISEINSHNSEFSRKPKMKYLFDDLNEVKTEFNVDFTHIHELDENMEELPQEVYQFIQPTISTKTQNKRSKKKEHSNFIKNTVPFLKKFNPKYLKKENIDKQIIRKFRNFLLEAMKSKSVELDIEDKQFWMSFIKFSLFPPMKYTDSETSEHVEFKSLNSNYLVWIFSKSASKYLWIKFLESERCKYLEIMKSRYEIKNYDLEQLEYYFTNMPSFYQITAMNEKKNDKIKETVAPSICIMNSEIKDQEDMNEFKYDPFNDPGLDISMRKKSSINFFASNKNSYEFAED